jgi:hypothetical protein
MLPSYITSFLPNSSVCAGMAAISLLTIPSRRLGPSASTIVSGKLNPFPGTGNTTTEFRTGCTLIFRPSQARLTMSLAGVKRLRVPRGSFYSIAALTFWSVLASAVG